MSKLNLSHHLVTQESGLPQRIHDHDPAEAALARCLVIVVPCAEDMMAEMERHCASLCLLVDPVIQRARVISRPDVSRRF
jgi:hypothetical protein